jgi:hypothetical protein
MHHGTNLVRVLSHDYIGTTTGWKTDETGFESGKAAEAADHSPPTSVEVKNERS